MSARVNALTSIALRRCIRSSDERDRIVHMLKETKSQVGGPYGAAAGLGLKRTTLISRMKSWAPIPKRCRKHEQTFVRDFGLGHFPTSTVSTLDPARQAGNL